ncbi:hypothetical protein CJU90_5566 [Yarrowia sp. C11]|nr:hypothetical protein CJU90_5566 [Yarrowia sp. C11]KAG5364153.1 hypothetical protein CKK34_2944 [Yarrowia sp. E02]
MKLCWPKWTYGPSPPVSPNVTLWCKSAQLWPLRLRDGPKLQRDGHRRTVWSAAMIVFVAIWWIISISLFTHSFWRLPEDTTLSGCAENWHVWKQDCGVNATGCLPAFEPLPDGTRREMRLKCPVGCVRGSWKWGDTLVGMQSVQYRPYVIGGGLDQESDVQEDEQADYEESDLHVGGFYKRQEQQEEDTNRYYRADSSPCAAAVHAGLVSPYTGGTFRLRFEGPRDSFMGSKGAHTIDSIDFDAPFPASFSVHEDHVSGGTDNRIAIVAFCVTMSFIFGYFCVNVAGFYWVQFLASFWLLVMVADPIVDFSRGAGATSLTVREYWLSMAVERLLPAMLGGYIIYRAAVKNMIGTDENPARTPGGDDGYANVGSVSSENRVDRADMDEENDDSDLENADSFKSFDQIPRSLGTPSLSRLLLWTSGMWCGVLENYTFANLPVDRLMVSDLNARPEGWIVVIVFVLIIIAAIASQTYLIWRAGLFQRYIVVYVALVLLLVGLGLVGALNNLELRIHHYIIGLVLVTGASTYTHLGLLYQGLLIGLYVNGVGRWGFDSTLESPSALARGSVVNEQIELMLTDSELTWGPPPGPGAYTPSLMVDDVVVLTATGMDDGVDIEYIESVVGRRPTFIRAGYVDGGYSLPLVL